jgi:DNA-directed RNA polymerase specialized sigma24 family protein
MSTTPSSVLGPELRAALVAMVRKRVPEAEVEDIVQSALAEAFESKGAPTDPESLRKWIFGVAKNKVVDYHRRAGRETFEVPEVAGRPAPHAEADLLRWAEKNLPPGEENKTTLDWMLREGEGEKLEWIAESERVPAPRVRQRVSRLRRHLKTHWQKEVTLLAALGVLVTIAVLVLRKKDPEPIANEDIARGVELRREGLDKCAAALWKDCLSKLDEAKRLDPAGDTTPAVRGARDDAARALSAPVPAPTPTPTPTSSSNIVSPPPPPEPEPSSLPPGPTKTKFAPTPTVAPVPLGSSFPAKPAAPSTSNLKSSNKDSFGSDDWSGGSKSAPPVTGIPSKKSAPKERK